MFDCLTKTQVISLKEFTAESINYLVWELGIEFEITLTEVGELNFEISFLYFNVDKKIYAKITLTINIEY